MDGSDDGSGSEPDSFGCRSGNRAGEGGEWQVVRSKKSRRLSEDRDSSGSGVRGETVKRRKEEYLILIQFESESAGVLNPVRLTSEIKSALGDVAGAKVLRGVGGGNAPSVGLPSAINLKEEEEEEGREIERQRRSSTAELCVSVSMASYLLVLLLLCILGQSFGQSQLKLVTVLYRHGDRSPVKAFPTDPHQESAWPQGFGQLTQEGMRQHLELGQFLRRRYQGFLSEPYTRYEIAVRSTDYDRTLMSAESNLAGLYPPNGSQVFHPGLNWQPIPIHTVPQDQERLLSFPLSNCAYYQRLMNETEKTELFINMTKTYADFLEMVRNKTGVESTTIASIWSIHDTLFCEEKHGMTLPDWVTPDVMSTLQFLKNFGFQIMFGVHKRVEKSRLQGGLLLDQIIKNFTTVSSLKPNGQLKMIMYSAHDTTIVALHEALNVFNGLQPPYASCHIMELHQDSNGSFSVEIFYRNDSSVAEPYPLTIPGCAHHCSLEEFIKLTQSVIPTDWDKECMMNTGSTDTDVIIGLAVCGCVLLLLVMLLFVVLCRQSEPSIGYSHVINQSDDHS